MFWIFFGKDMLLLISRRYRLHVLLFIFGTFLLFTFYERHVCKEKSAIITILDFNGYIESDSDYWVDNCRVTRDKAVQKTAHAVVITNRKLESLDQLPSYRCPWQRWVWLIDENPYNAVHPNQPFTLADIGDIFNWTMTYRKHSDIHIPYGFAAKKLFEDSNTPDLGDRRQLVSAVISNCHKTNNRRMEYIEALNKSVSVTLFGKCGTKCPGYIGWQPLALCDELHKFKFYLAFENANCKEYITEKLFGNGFEMGTVPVVMGATKQDYIDIAPPHSFIYVSDFKTPKELGKYLLYLSNNKTAYMEYHAWRKTYRTSYRFQYLNKSVWLPLCDKLHKDLGIPKMVKNISSFWTNSDCNEKCPW